MTGTAMHDQEMVTIDVQSATDLQIDWLVGQVEGLSIVIETVAEQRARLGEAALTTGSTQEHLDRVFATLEPILSVQDNKGHSLGRAPRFSGNPAAAQPIINREGISTRRHAPSGLWYAMSEDDTGTSQGVNWSEFTYRGTGLDEDPRRQRFQGPTQIAAAMKCHLGTKLGSKVEVPAELCREVTKAEEEPDRNRSAERPRA